MKKRLESDLLTDVHDYLIKMRVWHYRTQMGDLSGLPDIIACVAGHFVGIELKREDGLGKPTKQQLKIACDIIGSGGYGLIIDSLDDVKKVVEEIENL